MNIPDIKLFCCNGNKITNSPTQAPNNSIVSTLGETMPEKRHTSEDEQDDDIWTPTKTVPYTRIYNRFLELYNKKCDIQEFCITFKPRFHKDNATTLHIKVKKFFDNLRWEKESFRPSFLLMPEFNKSGILHYHGIIYFDDANEYWTAYVKRKCNSKFGNTKGKTIFNFDNYYTYMMKDKHKNKFTIQPIYYLHPKQKPDETKREER